MLAPISARLASSFSRNGIIAVATETICMGETSISSTCSGFTTGYASSWRTWTMGRRKWPFSSSGSLPGAMWYRWSTSAVMYSMSLVTTPFFTLR